MRERTTIAVVLALGLTAPIVAATVAIAHAVPSSRLVAWAAGLVFAALSWAGALMLRRRLPATLDGAAQRRPLRAILWMLLALLALAQLGRLSAFMADPANVWGSAFPDPGLTRHACMSAYVHAGDL